MDVNDLKLVNDRFGHAAGDETLRAAAQSVRGCSRDGTDSGYRVGGDEFALLVFSPTPKGLDELVDRLRNALTQAGIQASIGAALSEERTTLDQTWAKADDAMYGVKTSALAAAPTPSETA